jgi:parallel beta helix pectate lyase-like protein
MPAMRFSLVVLLASVAGAMLIAPEPRSAAAQQAPCTAAAAPADAQARIDLAPEGAVICLAAGVYRGPLRVENKRGITVRGAGARQTIIAGGSVDALLVFRSQNLTFEDFTLFLGNPSNAYVWGSTNVNFVRIDAGGGGIGVHFDNGSLGRVSDSFIYAMTGDGVLTRNAADVTVERSWVFVNGGVGVSTVGNGATTAVIRNIISDNGGPGVFVGVTPCALLPPGFVEVPECYLNGLATFVSDANIVLDSNVIQASGSTGIVLFPGTNAVMRKNRIWSNHLSGLFVWGGNFSSEADEYDLNDEHAIEARAFPDPLLYPEIPSGQRIRAVGRINNNVIRNTVVLPETGTLGGGVLGQGANMDVTNSKIYGNRGIGVSYVNTSLGRIENNEIHDNGGSAICMFRAGAVTATGNTIYGNARDGVGICHETTP